MSAGGISCSDGGAAVNGGSCTNGAGTLIAQDEGIVIDPTAIGLNFVGAGVIVGVGVGNIPTVTIPAAAGGVDTEDEGAPINTPALTLDFVGAGVVVTDGGGGKSTITIAGGGAGNMTGEPTSIVDGLVVFKDTSGLVTKPNNTFRNIDGSLGGALTNNEGAALAIGDVMMIGAAAQSVELASADTDTIAGVVTEAAAAGAVPVWMALDGEATVKCDAGVIAIGDHLDSAGGGLAHTHGYATGNTFAVALTAKGAGVGTVRAWLNGKSGPGDVVGPLGTKDEQIAVFDGVTGRVLKAGDLSIIGGALAIFLNNETGGNSVVGNVMQVDTLNAQSVVDVTPGSDSFAGIALQVVADGATLGLAAIGQATVNCTGPAIAIGDFIRPSPVTAGTGGGTGAPVSNSFGVALTAKASGAAAIQVLLMGKESF